MKLLKIRHSILTVAGLAALAACSQKSPPIASTPPPPVVVVPPQPVPPSGASANLVVPSVDAQGVRRTVNTGLSSAQATWNLRSAYNVAALNCMQPEHAQIVVNYRAFLKAHTRRLAAVNKLVDDEFKGKFGPRFIAPREAYMTQVYNYFALPPTLPAFCDAVLAMSNEAAGVSSAELESFAVRSLPNVEAVFLQFYRSYEQYRDDLSAWQAKYMAPRATMPVALTLPPSPAQQPQAR